MNHRLTIITPTLADHRIIGRKQQHPYDAPQFTVRLRLPTQEENDAWNKEVATW